MTALQLNGSAAAATTLAAAGKLFAATGGTSGNTSTKVSAFASGTNYKQIFALGTTTAQGNGVTSIPAPTDSNFHGWMWDVTTLEGQHIAAGAWTPTIHLLASTGTTVTPTVEWYKRSSGGSYTQIGTVTGSSIALTTSAQLLVFTPPSLSLMDFATGDKLVMWLWVNQTAGGATNSTISVVEATSGSSLGVASEAQAVTPGYAPTPVTLACTLAGSGALLFPGSESLYTSTVLTDSPIRYYRLDTASGTTVSDLGSQAQNGTIQNAAGVTLQTSGLLSGDSDTAMTFVSTSLGYISLPTTGLPTGSASWTMEAWVSLSSLPPVYRPILDLGGGYAVLYAASTNKFAIDVHAIVDLQANVTFTTATTYHVVATYDGNNLTLYVNGAQVATQAIGAITVTYGTASIGFDGTNYWNGPADEAAIFSTALSSTRVATHHTTGISPLALALATSSSSMLAGSGTLTATLALATSFTQTLVGSGTLTATISTASSSAALAGTLAGSGSLSTTLSLTTALGITFTGVGTATLTLAAQIALTTTLAGAGTFVMGSATLTTALALTTTGTGTLAPGLSASLQLASVTLAGTSTLTGTASEKTVLTATLSGVGTLAPTGTFALALASVTLVGAGSLSGTTTLATALSDTLAASGLLTAAALDAKTTLTSALAGASTLAGTLSGNAALAETMQGASTLAGTCSLAVAEVSTLMGSGQLSGTLTASMALTGALAGMGQLAGTSSLATVVTTTMMAVSTLSGTSTSTFSLVIVCSGSSQASGTMGAATAFSLTLVGNGQLITVLVIAGTLVSSLAGRSMVMAVISFPGPSATATWKTRDFHASWQTRDLAATWQTRDLEDTWQTRDLENTWQTRDLENTWKTRR